MSLFSASESRATAPLIESAAAMRSTCPDLSELVTIVVSPRERHYSTLPSLKSLFATIPAEVRVIVVQGDVPSDLGGRLRELRAQRSFELVEMPFPLYPNEARNLGLAECRTEFVVLADNDINYEPGWLDALVRQAQTEGADLVAPLIFIGPPCAQIIHHAGGRIRTYRDENGDIAVREYHQLMDQPFAAVDINGLGTGNEVVEFHCFLGRSAYLNRCGPLEERFITAEQIDFGMRAFCLSGLVTFAGDSHVTYVAKEPFHESDLEYLAFRWNDDQAIESLRTFASIWNIEIDSAERLNHWIRPHRARAYGTLFRDEYETLPRKTFRERIASPLEERALERADSLRGSRQLTQARLIDSRERDAAIHHFWIDLPPDPSDPQPLSVRGPVPRIHE